jgi:hypothetical protein
MMPDSLNFNAYERHNDLGHIIANAHNFFSRSQNVAKISAQEFFAISDWHYTIPVFTIDFVDTITGTKLVEEV